MPTPAFTVVNPQIKTTLRWYTRWDDKIRYRPECKEEIAGCRYRLYTPLDSLLPFELARPFSVLGITSWKIYDLDDNEVYDLATNIPSLTIRQFDEFDYIIYAGDVLSVLMDSGYYYSAIETAGETYYSEDFYVPCQNFGANALPEPVFEDGLNSDHHPAAIWGVLGGPANWNHVLTGIETVAGDPSDPDWQFEGALVANTGDNSLYEYSSGNWSSIPIANGSYWWDNTNGRFMLYTGGMWTVSPTDPVELDENGACWDGTEDVPIFINIGALDCTEVIVGIEVTVAGYVQGSISAEITGGIVFTISGNGTQLGSGYIANGSLLTLTPSDDFEGCVTSVKVYCPARLDQCQMKLTWTNCGNVGNLYYGTSLVQNYYLPPDVIRPRATTKLVIEEVENDTGEVTETICRKETTYTVFLGLVPWFVADALTEMCLHDTVKMITPGEGSAFSMTDTLLHPRVDFPRNDRLSKCLVPCTLTFQLDNTNVACCEVFDAPCRSVCVDASGFDNTETPVMDKQYLSTNAPEYSTWDGGAMVDTTTCESGFANFIDEEDALIKTIVWNVGAGQWTDIATNTLASFLTLECDIVLRWSVLDGYRAILQHLDDGDVWQDVLDFDMTPEEWAVNSLAYEVPDTGFQNSLRLKVYVDDCIVGYSQVVEFECPD